jgi:hypothetical protein
MQKHILKRKRLLAFAAISMISMISVSFYEVVWSARTRESEPKSANVVNSTGRGNVLTRIQEPRDLTALVFAVRATGFDPDELTVSSGRYLIVVQNRSGLRDLTFRFERETGERLHEVRPQGLNWKRQFELQPGTYILSEANHPGVKWRCGQWQRQS